MLHHFIDDRPWFRSKSFGFGAGLPILWQGWALIAAHLLLILGISWLLHGRGLGQGVGMFLAAIAPLPLYHAKTQGGWHWHWGRKQ